MSEENRKQINFRAPKGNFLYERIEAAANKSYRGISAYIIMAVEKQLEIDGYSLESWKQLQTDNHNKKA